MGTHSACEFVGTRSRQRKTLFGTTRHDAVIRGCMLTESDEVAPSEPIDVDVFRPSELVAVGLRETVMPAARARSMLTAAAQVRMSS